ncbi:MAG: DUF3592 domain-containing protein [Bacillota bacterium]|nr:DUF3592 domain-containing protein [Bacillota bacterium]
MESSESESSWGAIIVGIILLILSIMAAVEGYFSNNWETGKGKIISSMVVYGSEEYDAEIKYEYMVGDRRYIGHSITTAEGLSMNYDEAKAAVDKYYFGREVEVYYDTENPQKAALETGISPSAYYGLAMGLFVFYAGILEFRKRSRS